jgi:4-hydroxybenzoate polyprenyltransferase
MKTLWGLTQAIHTGPTLAVTTLAGLLAVAFSVPAPAALILTLAVFLNQASVGISNDVIDSPRDIDAERWEKPLARGALSVPVAWSVAAASAGASMVLSVLVHPMVALWQGVFLLAGWAYNLGLKATAWSGACYALGFGALPVLVSYAANPPQFPPWWVVFVAASLGLSAHFANVLPDLLVDRLQGVRGLPQRLGAAVVPGALVGLTMASGIALVLGAGAASAMFTAPAALLSLGLATWAAARARTRLPGALPFQLSMAAALVMAIGLVVGLTQ